MLRRPLHKIKSLERVGADIVRVSVPTMDAAEAFKIIKQQVNAISSGYSF